MSFEYNIINSRCIEVKILQSSTYIEIIVIKKTICLCKELIIFMSSKVYFRTTSLIYRNHKINLQVS